MKKLILILTMMVMGCGSPAIATAISSLDGDVQTVCLNDDCHNILITDHGDGSWSVDGTEIAENDTAVVDTIDSVDTVYIDTDTGADIDTGADADTGTGTGVEVDTAVDTTATETVFSIVVLPDTQNYIAWKPIMYQDQADWIVANKDLYNIKFVAHEGDVVGGYAAPEQWAQSQVIMDTIFNPQTGEGISYGISYGNHDGTAVDGNYNTNYFNNAYPLSLFESMDGYGGAFEAGKSDNTYFTFSAGGRNVLMIFLEFGARDSVLEWAKTVADNHPNHIGVVTTHAYSNENNALLGDPGATYKSPLNGYGLDASHNDGRGMFDKLVYPASNIQFVLSGHVGANGDGAGNILSQNSAGKNVHQMMINMQYYWWGHTGQLRLLEFKSDDSVQISTYSPWLDEYLTDSDNQFSVQL